MEHYFKNFVTEVVDFTIFLILYKHNLNIF